VVVRGLFVISLLSAGCDYAFRVDHIDRIDARVDAVDARPSYDCTFGPAMAMPGFNGDARDPEQRFDGLELSWVHDEGTDYDIHRGGRANQSDDYNPGAIDDELSSGNNDTDPALTGDGLRIFFLSTRGGMGKALFEATRPMPGEAFGIPAFVDTGGPINGIDVSADGRTLYFDDNGDNVFKIERAGDAGAFGALMMVAANAGAAPSVAKDALTLYYFRGTTVYRQHRTDTASMFGDETAITDGQDPDISADNRTLIVQTPTGFSMLTCP
jgi:hypothetical protein